MLPETHSFQVRFCEKLGFTIQKKQKVAADFRLLLSLSVFGFFRFLFILGSTFFVRYLFFPSGIVGVDENGETFTYNGLITKHWVRTQRDEIKIGKVSSKFLLSKKVSQSLEISNEFF